MTQLKLGQTLSASIEKIATGGDGIARISQPGSKFPFVLFVPYVAPGDKLEVEIEETRKSFARGKIKKIIQGGPGRIPPPCPYYFSPEKPLACGGCNLQHLNLPAQVQVKRQLVQETLGKMAGIPAELVLETLHAPEELLFRFRNKLQVPFGLNEKGVTAGFYAAGSHGIVPFEDCLIHPEPMIQLVRFIRDNLKRWGLDVYSERNRRGWLRHVLIRRESGSGKMLLVFVSAGEPFPKEREIAGEICKAFPSVSGILQNINTERTNVILGEKWHRVFGQDYLVEKLEDLLPGGKPLILKVSVSSFFQVNTKMARLLYSTALEFASGGRPSIDAAALDLYCGVGGIALALAGRFGTVLGIEESRSAIKDAQENARVNTCSNVRFLCGGVREHLRDLEPVSMYPEGLVVVLDPPRSGCAPDVLEKIIRLSPSRIVYVSCDPGTLARDLKLLKERGFAVKKVQPIDMFPQSSHIETVTLLEPCPKP